MQKRDCKYNPITNPIPAITTNPYILKSLQKGKALAPAQ